MRLALITSWAIFNGKLAYNGSWETEAEAAAFAAAHPINNGWEISQVEMFELVAE